MKKIELKSRKLLRKIFGGISLTAAAFIFQACYGTIHDMNYDVKLTGTVKSKDTALPIKGIKVSVNDGLNYGYTGEDGKFDFYANIPNWNYSKESINIHFLDIDGIENGHFSDKTIGIESANSNEVKINVELDEK